jgi:hypothetical protein
MDLLFEPYIHRNYIQYKSFPFSPEGLMGKETAMLNVFTFWNYYLK